MSAAASDPPIHPVSAATPKVDSFVRRQNLQITLQRMASVLTVILRPVGASLRLWIIHPLPAAVSVATMAFRRPVRRQRIFHPTTSVTIAML